jgi:predicted HTH domain antitoxin
MSSIVGVRLTTATEKAVKEIMREEGVDKSTAVRMLIETGYKEWRLHRSLRLLQDGKVSVWKAAEIAGVGLWDFLNILRKENIQWVEFDPNEILLQSNQP